MKVFRTDIITIFVLLAATSVAASEDAAFGHGPTDAESSSETSLLRVGSTGGLNRALKKSSSSRRSSSICDKCPFPTYYHYAEVNPSDEFLQGRFAERVPNGCVLAAIRDEASRRGAQYAVPEGKIAITQGYFPIDDYIHQCHFQGAKTLQGLVFGCSRPNDRRDFNCCRNNNFFTASFKNFEGTNVPEDCWDDIKFPIPDGATYAAIGGDGLLRPVKNWKIGGDFGWDGAVYECCPQIAEVCAQMPPDDA